LTALYPAASTAQQAEYRVILEDKEAPALGR
jgi:hypothetical protein